MESKDKKFIVDKDKNVFDSFARAFDGIKSAYATEYHMVIHCYFAVAVIICGALFQISYYEWLICFILIGAVIALELVNTAIESVVNMITTDYNVYALYPSSEETQNYEIVNGKVKIDLKNEIIIHHQIQNYQLVLK